MGHVRVVHRYKADLPQKRKVYPSFGHKRRYGAAIRLLAGAGGVQLVLPHLNSRLHSSTTAITVSCLYYFKNDSICVESEWSLYLVLYWYVQTCKCPVLVVKSS